MKWACLMWSWTSKRQFKFNNIITKCQCMQEIKLWAVVACKRVIFCCHFSWIHDRIFVKSSSNLQETFLYINNSLRNQDVETKAFGAEMDTCFILAFVYIRSLTWQHTCFWLFGLMYDRAEQLIAFTLTSWYVSTRFLNRIWLVMRSASKTEQGQNVMCFLAPFPFILLRHLQLFNLPPAEVFWWLFDCCLHQWWRWLEVQRTDRELCGMELAEPPPDQFLENQAAGGGLQQTKAFSTCTMYVCITHMWTYFFPADCLV